MFFIFVTLWTLEVFFFFFFFFYKTHFYLCNNLSYSLGPTPLSCSPGVQVSDLNRSTGVWCHGRCGGGLHGTWTPVHLLHKHWLPKLGGISPAVSCWIMEVLSAWSVTDTHFNKHTHLSWTRLCLSQGIYGCLLLPRSVHSVSIEWSSNI